MFSISSLFAVNVKTYSCASDTVLNICSPTYRFSGLSPTWTRAAHHFCVWPSASHSTVLRSGSITGASRWACSCLQLETSVRHGYPSVDGHTSSAIESGSARSLPMDFGYTAKCSPSILVIMFSSKETLMMVAWFSGGIDVVLMLSTRSELPCTSVFHLACTQLGGLAWP